MPEPDSDPSMRSHSTPMVAEHKTSSRGNYGAILAAVMSVVAVTLLALAFEQNRELARIRSDMENNLRLRKDDLRRRDEHMRYVYGIMLREQGATHHAPSGTYRFEGGVRVAAGDRWCVLDANEDFEIQQLKDQLEFIAPAVFPPPAYYTHIGDHVEWVNFIFENDLEKMKEEANKSPERLVQRTFSGDVERHAIWQQAIVTTITIHGSGARPRYSIRMELSADWMRKNGLWLSE